MQDNLFIRYKLHHVLFWIVAGCLWYYLRYQDYSTAGRAVKVTLIKVIDLALLIYITNKILVPFFLFRKRYLYFALAFVAMILVSSYLKMQLIGYVLNNPGAYTITAANFKLRLYDNVIPHFFLVTAGVSVKLIFDYTSMQKRLAEIGREKAETELGFLKSQINPHFLFNSLNAVYFLIEKENKEARQALHKFSEMLRYQLYEMNGDKLPVEKEIAYLRDYVAMQRLRKEDDFQLQFTVDENVKGFSLEPLLLIPFVENAFKHISAHQEKPNFILIDAKMENDYLYFSVKNSREELGVLKERGGIGLKNVQRRLELVYPGNYELTITPDPATYTILLKLKIRD